MNRSQVARDPGRLRFRKDQVRNAGHGIVCHARHHVFFHFPAPAGNLPWIDDEASPWPEIYETTAESVTLSETADDNGLYRLLISLGGEESID